MFVQTFEVSVALNTDACSIDCQLKNDDDDDDDVGGDDEYFMASNKP